MVKTVIQIFSINENSIFRLHLPNVLKINLHTTFSLFIFLTHTHTHTHLFIIEKKYWF